MLSKRLKSQHHYSPRTIDDLPDEVLTQIFNGTDFKSILLCSLVCKRWLKVCNSNINFMRTVNLKISVNNIDCICEIIRTYRLISINKVSFDQFYLVEKWKRLLANCETLNLFYCNFQNNKQVATLFTSCKSLKFLIIDHLVLNDNGFGERDDWEESANNFPIKLELKLYDISTWMILRLFPILRMQLSGLHLDLRKVHPRSEISILDMADMLAFVHQNYSSVFNEFYVDKIIESSLPPLFINQIKQLTDFTIGNMLTYNIFNQICENLIELQKLSIVINTDSTDLNNLKSLPNLKSLRVNLMFGGVSKLSICELHLERVEISRVDFIDDGPCKLEFPVPTPVQQITSVKELYIKDIRVTRYLLQQIFNHMPNLEVLFIRSSQRTSQPKWLTFKKNSINKLTNLRSLSIDGFWIDDSFLSKMRLLKLVNFRIIRNDQFRYKGMLRSLVQRLYMHCPKLKPIQFYTNGEKDDACYITNDEDPESTTSDLSDYSEEITDSD
jgi:hypothetical protein